MIENINIYNFKSIHNLTINGLKKINLFIGRPNVGKSNIIEALSLFTIPCLKYNVSKKITQLIRLENISEIFHDGTSTIPAVIQTNIGQWAIDLDYSGDFIYLKFTFEDALTGQKFLYTLDDKLNIKAKTFHEGISIKRYIFKSDIKFKKDNLSFLLPPFGNNLLQNIELKPELKKTVIHWFSLYGLDTVFDKASQSLKIMKRGKDNTVFILPYSSMADTLQRIIFFKTAIASNRNSVLLFEEPEAHAFPPYIVHITQEIIHSQDNQFFIATHSPYILNDFLENARQDLAIFMVDYKDNQTTLKALSKEEITDVYEYGVDLFFNNENYI